MPGNYVWTPTPDVIERANVTRFMRRHGIADHRELVARSDRRHRMVLARGARGPGHRVLPAARRDPGREPGDRLVPMVRRRGDQPGITMPRPACAVVPPRPRGRDLGGRGRLGAAAVLWRAARRDLPAGRGAAAAGDRPGRPRSGCSCRWCPRPSSRSWRAPRSARSRSRSSPASARGPSPPGSSDGQAVALITADVSFRRGKAIALEPVAREAADACPSVRHVIVARSGERPRISARPDARHLDWDDARRARAGRVSVRAARPGDPVDDHVHVGHDRAAQGGGPRPRRVPGQDRAGGGPPGRHARRRRAATGSPTWAGSWARGSWSAGWPRAGRSCWPRACPTTRPRSALVDGRAPRGHDPGRLADLDPRLIKHGVEPVRSHDLSRLRILASTGEPWDPESWRWLFENVGGGRLPIINITGGTEVGACLLSAFPTTPLKPCSLVGPSLGMAVDVFDPDGKPLGPGQGVGELVCTKPWPAMTRGIWGDPERYLATYWSRWPDVWVHGDWASIDEDGDWFLHGRSDDTIKVAGKRLGPAEVESILNGHDAVAESAAVGVPHSVKGEVILGLRRHPARMPARRLRCERSSASASPRRWASRSRPRRSGSSPSCPRPAAARSSAASSSAWPPARTPATCRPSRTSRPSRPCGGRSERLHDDLDLANLGLGVRG